MDIQYFDFIDTSVDRYRFREDGDGFTLPKMTLTTYNEGEEVFNAASSPSLQTTTSIIFDYELN